MKRLVWLTDIHLEFLSSSIQLERFCQKIKLAEPDTVLIGGDTGTAETVEEYLRFLENCLRLPIYFVLGNHDFYNGSIREIRKKVEALSAKSKNHHWLTAAGVIELSNNTALIGHDGWADGRLGKGVNSTVELNDYFLIRELTGLNIKERFEKLNELGGEAAKYFQKILPQALKQYRNIFLLTHVPPFRNACMYRGKISDDEYLPHFSSKCTGDVLIEIMKQHPESKLTVLSGHTHGKAEVRILSNLYIKVGGAEYGRPKIQETFEIE